MSKRISVAVLALIAGFALYMQRGSIDVPDAGPRDVPAVAIPDDARLREAIRTRSRDVQVTGSGTVQRVLADDLRGSRHQRFILRLASGETVLVAHNIDLARRLESLDPGERVDFAGEYEWTGQGGVVHWTHRDPDGRHVDGWLRHAGTLVQ